MQLSESTVLITGAASGIGLATGLNLKDCGARVIGIDRDEEAIARAAEQGLDVINICQRTR